MSQCKDCYYFKKNECLYDIDNIREVSSDGSCWHYETKKLKRISQQEFDKYILPLKRVLESMDVEGNVFLKYRRWILLKRIDGIEKGLDKDELRAVIEDEIHRRIQDM